MSSRKSFVSPLLAAATLSFAVQSWAAGPAAGAKGLMLGDYPYPTTTDSEFAAEYNGKTYGNRTDACPDCKAELISTKDGTGDFARMNFTLAATGASAFSSYFANVGAMLPLDNLWSSSNDLRTMTKVWFKARTSSAAEAGINLKVNLDGPAFPFGSAGYTRIKNVQVTTEWTWFGIGIKEFAYASWMKSDANAASPKKVTIIENLPDGTTKPSEVVLTPAAVAGKLLNADSANSPDYDKDAINGLKNVKMIQFGIDPAYGPGGVALDPDYALAVVGQTLDIDSVFFEGAEGGWAPLEGKGCVGHSETIEDFNMANPSKPNAVTNYAGGSWFAYSDTSSAAPVAGKDSAVGLSSVDPLVPDDAESVWGINDTAEIVSADMLAKLDKGDAAKHPYAGWAELGTSLVPAAKKAMGLDATGLNAIEFEIRAGGTDPFDVKFDKSKLIGVTFKVAKSSVAADATFEARIPFDQINANANSGDFVKVCADISAMKQPAWYTAKNGVRPMTTDSLTRLSWAVKIQKNKDVSALPSLVQIRNVKFYESPTGVKGTSNRSIRELEASYDKGLVISYSIPGTKAEIAITRVNGTRVAAFVAGATARRLALPVVLNQGTYLIVVRGEGTRRVVALTCSQ